MALLANVALTNTFDTWRLRTNALLTRVNAYTINESSLYANTLTANVSFTSKGLTTLQGQATVGTNLTVSGNTILGASGKVANATGWFGVTGRLTVSTNLFVAGNTSLGAANKTITTTGLISHTGRQTISTNLTVSGNTTLGGALKTVSTTGLLAHTGRATISTNLAVSGNTTLSAGLTQSGAYAQIGNFNAGTTGNSPSAALGGVGFSTNISNGQAEANIWNAQDPATYTSTGILLTQYLTSTTRRDLMFLKHNGLVGIGTLSPSYKLDVQGTLGVSTNLTVSGNTTLNGTTTDKSNALSQTLTDGATITWDTSLGRVATVTLGGNRTISAATNQKVGTYILRVVQDGTGGRTLTWNGNYKWTAQTAPVLSTAAGAVDIITFFSDGTKMYGSYLPDMR